MKRTTLYLIWGVVLSLTLVGCSGEKASGSKSTPSQSPSQDSTALTEREPSPGEIISEKAVELYEGIIEIEDTNCKTSDYSIALTLFTPSLQDTYDRFLAGDENALDEWEQIRATIIDTSSEIDSILPDVQDTRSTVIQFCDSDGEPIYLTISNGQALYDIVASAQEAAKEEANAQKGEEEQRYILNTSTKVFHYPSCPSVSNIKSENWGVAYGSHEDMRAKGYKSCGNCHP